MIDFVIFVVTWKAIICKEENGEGYNRFADKQTTSFVNLHKDFKFFIYKRL